MSDSSMQALMNAVTEKIQVVDADGQFLTDQLQQFAKDVHLAENKGDYQVVAIMGPQSSGKSTLLNHVFGTSFVMMDAMTGRSQTTKGIWLSKSTKATDRLTLVMDLEGSDGRERGEDDTNFERQIALFALAVSDILLVNIWCHDIGREVGSGKPLLRTIFQVNLKLFAPEPNRKRTVLLFVVRDKSKTPLQKLVEVLEDDLNKMWDSISKPPAYQDSKLRDFFDVQYAGMAHFEERPEDFQADATMLRRRFSPDDEQSLVRSHDDHLPGGAFVISVHSIWDTIRQQKDLNLPAHKIMVANIRCAEIARDQLEAFKNDQAWQSLASEATQLKDGELLPPVVPTFSTRLTQLMDSCIQGYQEDAMYFDAKVRGEKLEQLTAQLTEVVTPIVATQTRSLQEAQLQALRRELSMGLMNNNSDNDKPLAFTEVAAKTRAASVAAFKKAFNEHLRMDQKPWDGKDALAAYETAADEVIASMRTARIQDAVKTAVKHMSLALSGPVINLLDTCPQGLWPRLHAVTHSSAETAEKQLLQVLAGFKLTPKEEGSLHSEVWQAANARMESHVREAALTRMSRMKDRFTEMFTLDASKAPRTWKTHDNIPAIAATARLAAAQVLAQLAVIRPAPANLGAAAGSMTPTMGGMADAPADVVETAIMQLAQADLLQENTSTDGMPGGSGRLNAVGGALSGRLNMGGSGKLAMDANALDLLSLSSWPEIEESRVLLQPHEVRTSWRDFVSASNLLIQQAQASQQANRLAGNRTPPLWAMLAILVLGWNEFMAVLWNPLYLLLGAIFFLFGRSLYNELDVESELNKGALPGALSLAAKIGPATRAVASRTKDALQGFVQHPETTFENVRNLAHELEMSTLMSPLTGRDAASKKHDGNGEMPSNSTNSSFAFTPKPNIPARSDDTKTPDVSGLSKRRAANPDSTPSELL